MGRKSRRTGLHSRRQTRAFASGFSRTAHTRTPRSTGAFIIPRMGTPLQRGARRTAGPSPRTTARHRARTRTRGGGRNPEASSLKVGEARLPAIADDKFPSGTGPPNTRREPDTRATRCRTCRRPSTDAATVGTRLPSRTPGENGFCARHAPCPAAWNPLDRTRRCDVHTGALPPCIESLGRHGRETRDALATHDTTLRGDAGNVTSRPVRLRLRPCCAPGIARECAAWVGFPNCCSPGSMRRSRRWRWRGWRERERWGQGQGTGTRPTSVPSA